MIYGPGKVRYELIKFVGYINSDFTGNQLAYKLSDSKSTAKYVFFLTKEFISSQLKRQTTVTQSIIEAKYYGLNSDVRKAIWIR